MSLNDLLKKAKENYEKAREVASRSGLDVPYNTYVGKLSALRIFESSGGNPCVRMAFTITEGDNKGLQAGANNNINNEVGLGIAMAMVERLGGSWPEDMEESSLKKEFDDLVRKAPSCRFRFFANKGGYDTISILEVLETESPVDDSENAEPQEVDESDQGEEGESSGEDGDLKSRLAIFCDSNGVTEYPGEDDTMNTLDSDCDVEHYQAAISQYSWPMEGVTDAQLKKAGYTDADIKAGVARLNADEVALLEEADCGEKILRPEQPKKSTPKPAASAAKKPAAKPGAKKK